MTDTWVQTTSLDAGQAFKMGRGSSRSVLGPAMGMSTITLNNSVFQADDEFPQHRHDISEDCMLVLRGAVSFRQTDAYTRIGELDFAWVPVAEVHGTVNTSGEEAELISFQSPPDVRLYAVIATSIPRARRWSTVRSPAGWNRSRWACAPATRTPGSRCTRVSGRRPAPSTSMSP